MAAWPFITDRRSLIRNNRLFCLVHRSLERLVPFFFFGLAISHLRILVKGRIVVKIALCYFFDTSSCASLHQVLLKIPISSISLTPFTCIIVQLFLPLHDVLDELLALLRVLSQSVSSLLDVLEDWGYAVLYLVELWLELGVVVGRGTSGGFFLSFWALVVGSVEEVVGLSLEGWSLLCGLGVWGESTQF